MSEQVLTVLKFCLLALMYLFLARVVWVVVRELRGTPVAAPVVQQPQKQSRKKTREIVVAQPDTAVYAIPFEGEATVGRGGGCAIILSGDTFVSTVHARFVEGDGGVWVEDLGSTNGTFVNEKKSSQPSRLKKGDRVHIGNSVLEVR